MITRVRASLVHEDIKLIVIKEFCVSIPRRHSRWIVRWLGVAPRCIRPKVQLGLHRFHSTKHRRQLPLWFCCFCRPPGSFRRIFVERDLCCLKSPDQGLLTSHLLINSSRRACTGSICTPDLESCMRILGQISRQQDKRRKRSCKKTRYIRIGDISIHHDDSESTRHIQNMICQMRKQQNENYHRESVTHQILSFGS